MPVRIKICIIAALSGLTAIATPQTLRLANGSEVTGTFTLQTGGYFLNTASGGRQYPWSEIDPMSLPDQLRQSLRQRLEDELQRAHTLYQAGQIEQAAPIFSKVVRHQHYLSIDAVGSPAYNNVERKARGWVVHKGSWMPFAQRQQQLGLIRQGNGWVTLERARTANKFNQAFADARRRDDHTRTILELLALIRENPGAPEIAEAEALVTRLTRFLERREAERNKQQQLQQKEQNPPPAQPIQVVDRIIERDVVRSPFSYHVPYNYGYGHGNNRYGSGFYFGGNHSHQSSNTPKTQVASQPGYRFKKSNDHFNTGFPFAPPVSVKLTGTRRQVPDGHSHGGQIHRRHGHSHRNYGVNVHGRAGNVGFSVHRKDPIKIRF